MSQYYKPQRKRGLFDPTSKEPYRLSRSRIEYFLECPRCFYLDRRLGTDRPPGYPFTLNVAVDILLKKEFDIHRAKGTAHPLMKEYGIKAVPLAHEDMELWRNNFKGVSYLHRPTNMEIFGAVDDLWGDKQGNIMVVDYKSTSTEKDVNQNDPKWGAYSRQMEIYQWLLRQNGHQVSDRGYFVYCNGRKDRKAFDAKIEFKVDIVPLDGDDSWVDGAIRRANKTLRSKKIPAKAAGCDYCAYREHIAKLERKNERTK
ncbi:PD-(D/E)XK nuclease family protein [Patescibacteria group bacterium]